MTRVTVKHAGQRKHTRYTCGDPSPATMTFLGVLMQRAARVRVRPGGAHGGGPMAAGKPRIIVTIWEEGAK